MGRLRHKREQHTFLYPLYVRSLDEEDALPLWLQSLSYVDCREADAAKLAAAAERLIA